MIGEIVVSLTYNVLYNTIDKTLHLDKGVVSSKIVARKTVMDIEISVSESGTVYVTSATLPYTPSKF